MSRIPRSTLLRGAAGLTLAGAVHALTFAPGPLPDWALAITQILMLAIAARVTLTAPSARQAWLRGWLFGFATYAVGLYWLFISMHRYGDLAAPLAVAGVLALSAFLALFPATASALTRRYAPLSADATPLGILASTLTWAAMWGGFEWLRAVLLTGFPWLNIGYAQVDSPIAGWAPLLGVHGMAFLAAFVAAAAASLWQPSRKAGMGPRHALAPIPVERNQHRQYQGADQDSIQRQAAKTGQKHILGVGQHQGADLGAFLANGEGKKHPPRDARIVGGHASGQGLVQPARESGVARSQGIQAGEHGHGFRRGGHHDMTYRADHENQFRLDRVVGLAAMEDRVHLLEGPPDVVMQQGREQGFGQDAAQAFRADAHVLPQILVGLEHQRRRHQRRLPIHQQQREKGLAGCGQGNRPTGRQGDS